MKALILNFEMPKMIHSQKTAEGKKCVYSNIIFTKTMEIKPLSSNETVNLFQKKKCYQ